MVSSRGALPSLLLLFLLLLLHGASGHFNLYLTRAEVFRTLGVRGNRLYYVREGVVNDYAFRYTVPVRPNTDALHFTWAATTRDKVEYSLAVSSDHDTKTPSDQPSHSKVGGGRVGSGGSLALFPPTVNISQSGSLPRQPTTFQLVLLCSGLASAEVRVTLSVNVTATDPRLPPLQLHFNRNKICFKDKRLPPVQAIPPPDARPRSNHGTAPASPPHDARPRPDHSSAPATPPHDARPRPDHSSAPAAPPHHDHGRSPASRSQEDLNDGSHGSAEDGAPSGVPALVAGVIGVALVVALVGTVACVRQKVLCRFGEKKRKDESWQVSTKSHSSGLSSPLSSLLLHSTTDASLPSTASSVFLSPTSSSLPYFPAPAPQFPPPPPMDSSQSRGGSDHTCPRAPARGAILLSRDETTDTISNEEETKILHPGYQLRADKLVWNHPQQHNPNQNYNTDNVLHSHSADYSTREMVGGKFKENLNMRSSSKNNHGFLTSGTGSIYDTPVIGPRQGTTFPILKQGPEYLNAQNNSASIFGNRENASYSRYPTFDGILTKSKSPWDGHHCHIPSFFNNEPNYSPFPVKNINMDRSVAGNNTNLDCHHSTNSCLSDSSYSSYNNVARPTGVDKLGRPFTGLEDSVSSGERREGNINYIGNNEATHKAGEFTKAHKPCNAYQSESDVYCEPDHCFKSC